MTLEAQNFEDVEPMTAGSFGRKLLNFSNMHIIAAHCMDSPVSLDGDWHGTIHADRDLEAR